jgi:histone acetyltransferase (RNA polymerase elongator complex component)
MDDAVLNLIKRGHCAADTEKAVCILRKRNYEVGLQMMVGLPGEDETSSLLTAQRIANLHPDFVRIYPTVVLKGSLLAEWYQKAQYVPLSLEEAVLRVTAIYKLFNKHNIPVIRMGLQASEDLDEKDTVLAGPYHPSFGELVYSNIFFDKALDLLNKCKSLPASIALKVHPYSISKMRGHRNQNIKKLKAEFKNISIKIITDTTLSEDAVALA